MPQDLYGRTKGPGMGPRPGMEEMDFSDDDATPLTEPIYSGRYELPWCLDMLIQWYDNFMKMFHTGSGLRVLDAHLNVNQLLPT